MTDNTSNRGLGSDKMSAAKKHEIQSKGGKAGGTASHATTGKSSTTTGHGAAGHTEAAKRGGQTSKRG